MMRVQQDRRSGDTWRSALTLVIYPSYPLPQEMVYFCHIVPYLDSSLIITPGEDDFNSKIHLV